MAVAGPVEVEDGSLVAGKYAVVGVVGVSAP